MADEELAIDFSDLVEELDFDQVFANCNSCGDTGVLDEDCWCGGMFNISRDPNVLPVDPNIVPVEVPTTPAAGNSASNTIDEFNCWWGGRVIISDYSSGIHVSCTTYLEPAVPWESHHPFRELNVASSKPAVPRNHPFGEPNFNPQDVGAKPGADGEEPESHRCTGCGCVDLFHQQSPFACLCGIL